MRVLRRRVNCCGRILRRDACRFATSPKVAGASQIPRRVDRPERAQCGQHNRLVTRIDDGCGGHAFSLLRPEGPVDWFASPHAAWRRLALPVQTQRCLTREQQTARYPTAHHLTRPRQDITQPCEATPHKNFERPEGPLEQKGLACPAERSITRQDQTAPNAPREGNEVF